jgi:hypothetical protein
MCVKREIRLERCFDERWRNGLFHDR